MIILIHQPFGEPDPRRVIQLFFGLQISGDVLEKFARKVREFRVLGRYLDFSHLSPTVRAENFLFF